MRTNSPWTNMKTGQLSLPSLQGR